MCNPITTDEPDLLLAKGDHKGFEWEVTHNGLGFRCGYIRIPKGHPMHGTESELGCDVDFHSPDAHCGKGGDDDAWWVGFHCMHAWDLPDPELPLTRSDSFAQNWGAFNRATLKTTDYVRGKCLAIIERLAEWKR